MPKLDYTRRDLLKLAAAGAVAPLLRPSAFGAPSDENPSAPKSESEVLADRAAVFRQAVLDVAMGPGGMIISFLPAHPLRPFEEGDPVPWFQMLHMPEGWGPGSPSPTPAEFFYGENTLWATGWLLYSQILRYRATKEPEAKETARKCFRDLNNIFRLCRMIEPGLLGHPHGGRPGPTTSYDQGACPVIFYVMYAEELATPEEKAEAVANMAAHGEYYLRHKWVMNQHGHIDDCAKANTTSFMKYLACEYAAYKLTGETRFRDETLKRLRGLIDAGRLPWPSDLTENTHNCYYWGLLCDYWHKSEFADEFDWIGCIREYWRARQASLGPDGHTRAGSWDRRKQAFVPRSMVWDPNSRDTWQRLELLGTESPFGWAMTAGIGLLAYSHGLDDKAPDIARRVLLRMDKSTIRWWWNSKNNVPEEMRPILDVYAPEVAGAWQVAYWMGRGLKTW